MSVSVRVLVADNDDLFREMLCLMLHKMRPAFHVVEVRNGQDAYTHYQQHGADLILTDDRMPVMTGTTLIRRLRSDGCCVPIMLLSSGHAAQAAAYHDVYTVLMDKPVMMTNLLTVIDVLLAT